MAIKPILQLGDPLLREKGRREIPFLREVRLELASQYAVIPWSPEPPIGAGSLRAFANQQELPIPVS